MGFKTETQAEMVTIFIIFIEFIIFIALIFLQIRVDGRPNALLLPRLWILYSRRQAPRGDPTVDTFKLSDLFRPAMRAVWHSYIQQVYPDGEAVSAGPELGSETLIVDA